MASPRRRPLAQAFKRARRVEGRAENPRYYALTEAPNAGEFGKAEYVDTLGRAYRVAIGKRTDYPPGIPIPPRSLLAPPKPDMLGRVTLWVKLRRGAAQTSWFAPLPGRATTLHLTPAQPGRPALTVEVAEAHRLRPTLRTGTVAVKGFVETTA